MLAELSVHSSYLNFNHFTRLENQMRWTALLIDDYQVSYLASFNNNNNSYFDRSNQVSLINSSIKKDFKLMPLTLSYSYNFEKNGGLPEDTVSVIDRKKQTITLFTEKNINDYLSISQELTRAQIKNALDSYNGNRIYSSINLNLYNQSITFRNKSSYLYQDTFLDKKRNLENDLNFSVNNSLLDATASIKLNNSVQDLYTYSQKTDELALTDIYNSLSTRINIFDDYSFNYSHNLSYKKNNYHLNNKKSNSIFDSVLDTYVQQYNDDYIFFYGFKYNYYKRELNLESQNRNSLTRMLYVNGLFKDVYLDTLQINTSILLTKNMHSTPNEFLDNDRQIKSISFIAKELFNPFLLFSTSASYQVTDEVFISKYLSSNNNVKSTYLLQPEITGILNNYLELFNRYQLRATFENYQWNDLRNDRYYRKLEFENGIRIKIQSNYFFLAEVLYTYITNETADKKNDSWLKNNENIVRIYSINLKLQNERFSFILEPQLKYEYHNFETELLFESDINLQKDTFIKFSFNPIGKTFNTFVWKAFVELSLTY